VISRCSWTADKDFAVRFANPDRQPYSEEADYDHFLPSLDFSVEVVDDVVLRASASKTIARAEYGLQRKVGKRADLILLDADPLADISNSRRISAVILGGRYLPRAMLDRRWQALAAH
jgi:hypothetical protein